MDKSEMAAQLRSEASKMREEATRLESAADTLEGVVPTFPRAGEVKRTGARTMSKETRERLSQAQKARWAKVKDEKKTNKKRTK